MNILALDIGTTSMRGILYDQAGHALQTETVATPLLVDQRLHTIEQAPETFLDGVGDICKRIAQTKHVDAISVTAFRSAPTLVGRDGRALCNFIMWQDTRNSAICKRLNPYNDQVYQACGAGLNTVFTASRLTWWKENQPELYHSAYKAMIVPDYVIHHMTGGFTTDYTYGSRTLLMDIRTLAWREDMCQLFGVSMDKLCQLQPQGSVCGTVRQEFARLTGIAQGTPVVSAGGDQQCGALGLGVLGSDTIEVNSGTGSFVISLVDRPYLENPSVICNVAAVPGMYTQEMNIISSASALNWLIREFFPDLGGDQPDFDAVNRIAADTPPGANGLVAVPHFQGCGSRDWNPTARAGFWGFSLGSRRQDMIRALYEGVAAEIAKSIDALPAICRSAGEIAVAGGLSRSSVYLDVLCDMTGRKLLHGRNEQATARGAMLSAAVAMGLYPDYRTAYQAVCAGECMEELTPNPANQALYAALKQRSERLYRAANQEQMEGTSLR